MAAAKKTPSVPAQPHRPGGARHAHTQEDALKIGLFGIEVDATDDFEYTVAGQLGKTANVNDSPKET